VVVCIRAVSYGRIIGGLPSPDGARTRSVRAPLLVLDLKVKRPTATEAGGVANSPDMPGAS
jgi:hypothetical protein